MASGIERGQKVLDGNRAKQKVRVLEPWRGRLDIGKNGPLRTSLHNAVIVISEHTDLQNMLAYDLLSEGITKTRIPPWGGESGEWRDTDAAELAAWFGDPERKLWSITSGLAHEAASIVASRNPIHPIRDYLNSLRWDETERVPHLLSDFYGARFDEYTGAVSLSWLISAVARAMAPGCKVDTMPVFEGRQGIGKSLSIRILFGKDWSAEAHESPAHKDFFQALRGRWVIEIAEMQSFSKPEVGKIKQAVSCPVDVYRESYGRVPRAFPRQCVFVGTTNEKEYLRDSTGGRRFLPVECGSEIDIEGIAQARDQLWAEALVRYRRGEPWWNFPGVAQEMQAARFMEDPWLQPIRQWLEGSASVSSYGDRTGPVNEVTSTELLHDVLGIVTPKQTQQDAMRLGKVMHELGWTRHKLRREGRSSWHYVRPGHQP